MKTANTPDTKTLDIRFISLDSQNPYALTENFSQENIDRVTRELHDRLGHLSEDIKKSNGHIRIYTQGNSVIGLPQYMNFSREVWDKLHTPLTEEAVLKTKSATDDYLDHENYNDL